MAEKTVRELGGEVWAEITQLQNSPEENAFSDVGFELSQGVCDLVMGVLARHVGTTIVNDDDFPVQPLEKKFTE